MGQRVGERWPAFAAELEVLLARSPQPQLAASVAELEVFASCGCGDDFCQSFATAPER